MSGGQMLRVLSISARVSFFYLQEGQITDFFPHKLLSLQKYTPSRSI